MPKEDADTPNKPQTSSIMYTRRQEDHTPITNSFICIIFYHNTHLIITTPTIKRYIMPAGAVFSSLNNFDDFKKKKKKRN